MLKRAVSRSEVMPTPDREEINRNRFSLTGLKLPSFLVLKTHQWRQLSKTAFSGKTAKHLTKQIVILIMTHRINLTMFHYTYLAWHDFFFFDLKTAHAETITMRSYQYSHTKRSGQKRPVLWIVCDELCVVNSQSRTGVILYVYPAYNKTK